MGGVWCEYNGCTHEIMDTIRERNYHYAKKHWMEYEQQIGPLRPFKLIGENGVSTIYRQCGMCPHQITRNNFNHYKAHRSKKTKCIRGPNKWRNPCEIEVNANEWQEMNDWRLKSLKRMTFIMDRCVGLGSLQELQNFIRNHRKGNNIHWQRWQFNDEVVRDFMNNGGNGCKSVSLSNILIRILIPGRKHNFHQR